MPKPRLTPAQAARLYSEGRMSACEIAAAYGITRQGAEFRIRAAGVGGLTWCRLCRTWEQLTLTNAEALARLPLVHEALPLRPRGQQLVLPLNTNSDRPRTCL